MHFYKPAALVAILAATSAAAAPHDGAEIENIKGSTIVKRNGDTDSDARDRCEDVDFGSDLHALIISYKVSGTIGSGGDPGITSAGNFWTFDSGCEQLDQVNWNGGQGQPDPISYMDDGFSLRFTIGNAALDPNRPPEPTDVEAGWPDEDTWARGPSLNCGSSFDTSGGFGSRVHWRICTFMK